MAPSSVNRFYTFVLFSIYCLFWTSCSEPEKAQKTPTQKFDEYIERFKADWQNENNRFQIEMGDMNVSTSEGNHSSKGLVATIQFPFNWTEFQYQEESDFAQGYDSIIQVHSKLSLYYQYMDGNWSFSHARQFDYNATLVEVADDYSRVIANAWIKRLPEERKFSEKEKLFAEIPPRQF